MRSDTLDVMETIAAEIPGAKVVRPRPEQEPYGCNNPLFGSRHPGAFFTGYWEVEVADDLDVAHFIAGLPEALGDGWREEAQAIRVPYAQVNLISESTHVSVTVEERGRNGKQGIDILAISPCGTE